MLRVPLTDATIEIKITDVITNPFTSNIGAPQGDSYSGPQFELYFKNSLRKVRRETGIAHQRPSWRNDLCSKLWKLDRRFWKEKEI